MLAGLSMLAAVLLAIFVVVLFRGGGEDGGPTLIVGDETPAATDSLVVKSIAITTVREGPGLDYVELGVLGADQEVQVVGRNGLSSWYQILYPPQSLLRGWVAASAVSIPEAAVAEMPIAAVTPIARPTVVPPTLAPEPTAIATALAEESPTPVASPEP